MKRAIVAVKKTTPREVFDDIAALMRTAGLEDAFKPAVTTILKDNISWHLPLLSANTTPWQLEGAIKALHAAGFPDLIAVHNNTVVTDPVRGLRLNKLAPVYARYKIPEKYNFVPEQVRERMFDYAGDSRRDLPVWSSARRAVVVHATRSLSRKVARVCEVERVLDGRAEWVRTYGRALRVHQWLKNLLVFVPLAVAHRSLDVDLLFRTCAAFVAFSLVGSSVYLLNDLIDLSADRHHPHKRERPFATGALSPFWGLLSSPVLCGLGFLTGALLPLPFAAVLAAYFFSNLAYSLWLKQVPVLDVIVLAGFYIARIVGGSAAIAVWPSPWIVAFSTFLFVSLALVKRYGELVTLAIVDGKESRARGYLDADKELLASMGAASGYVAVLVLAIFISTGAAGIQHARHQLIWLLCPTLLFWISYVWLTANRGQMYDDPLVFTLRDRVSRAAIIAAALILLAAR